MEVWTKKCRHVGTINVEISTRYIETPFMELGTTGRLDVMAFGTE